jgi:hypothetical protein
MFGKLSSDLTFHFLSLSSLYECVCADIICVCTHLHYSLSSHRVTYHGPDALMLLVLTYLKSKDYRYLSHCSHGYRHFITENDLLHFRFNREHSWLYNQSCIGGDIRVTISGTGSGLNLYEEVERRGGKVMKLTLFNCQEVRDVSMLGGVRELDLRYCRGITSGFECLGGVHSLNLIGCTQLRDEHINT